MQYLKKLTAALGLTIVLNSAYAGICTVTILNSMQNPIWMGPPQTYYLSSPSVADGTCAGGTCPTTVNKGSSITFSSNGQNWDTVLTAAVNQSSSLNVGSFRIEIQNATSSCTPVNIYTDYCSTYPASGKENCAYALTKTANNNYQLTVIPASSEHN